jgi:hypothetical protein
MIAAANLHKGERPSADKPLTGGEELKLADAGISYRLSSECQQIFHMPRERFDGYLALGEQIDEDGNVLEISKAGLLREAAEAAAASAEPETVINSNKNQSTKTPAEVREAITTVKQRIADDKVRRDTDDTINPNKKQSAKTPPPPKPASPQAARTGETPVTPKKTKEPDPSEIDKRRAEFNNYSNYAFPDEDSDPEALYHWLKGYAPEGGYEEQTFAALDALGPEYVAVLDNIMSERDAADIGRVMWEISADSAHMFKIADIVVEHVTEGDYTTIHDLSERVLDLRERCGELEHEIAQLKGTDFKTVKNQHGEFTIHSEPLDEAFERVDSENQQLRAQLANAEQTIERLEAALAHLEARPVKSDVVEEAVNSLIVAIFRAAGPSGLTEAELADKLTALAADAAD